MNDKVSCMKKILAKMKGVEPSVIPGEDVCDLLAQMAGMVETGPSKFVVTITGTSPTTGYTSDKTPSEITEAYNAGKIVECHFMGNNNPSIAQPMSIGEGLCYFSCDIMSTNTTCRRYAIAIRPDSTSISTIHYQMTLVTDSGV